MVKYKKLLILLGILIVLCVVSFTVQKVEIHKEKIKTSGDVVLSFVEDDVTSFGWTYEGTSYNFERSEGNWVLSGNEEFPVNQDKVNSLLSSINNYAAAFIIEEVEDTASYGLKDPTCKIYLVEKGKTKNLNFGGFSTIDSKRYFSILDGCAYLAINDLMESFNCAEKDIIQTDSIPNLATLSAITLENPQGTFKIIKEDNSDKSFSVNYTYFLDEDGVFVPASDDTVNSITKKLSSIGFSVYETYNAGPGEKAKYGTDEPDTTLTVSYFDENNEEQSFTLYLADEGDTCYGQFEGSNFIYYFTTETYKTFGSLGYDNLRAQKFVQIDWPSATKIKINLDGFNYAFDLTDEEKDYTEVTNAISALALDVPETEEDKVETKTLKKSVGFTIEQDNEKYPEVTFEIYQNTGSLSTVILNGEVIGNMPRSQAVDLIETINAIVLD